MSVSASAENLSSEAQSCDGGSMCLELALEGERLCKAGDCRAGVAFFLAAIQAGTDDLRTLSAIYSQLGNAYFYLGDYAKAMQYHKHDLTLARTMNDKLGEAKASGNLGNTLKVMGKFSEAIQCCRRHLELARALGDRRSEGRALYNLGNVHHAQGKALSRAGSDPGRCPQDARDALTHALHYYEENLKLMRELDDRAAAGRACGNLGNTCYLLGDFAQAIRYHTERLNIARDAGDKPAERRANSNLANSHIFLGQFENAAAHYLRTLALAEELGDAAVQAQACYSLGNTYTLLREYRAAETYHARHLAAARQLGDRVGEGRAAWSLGNAHAALGNHEKALYYATEHLAISKELGDVLGLATAQMNVSDLRRVLGLPADCAPPAPAAAPPRAPLSALRVRRQSMEQLALIQITPDGKKKESEEEEGARTLGAIVRTESEENPAESFFDLLSRCQSSRYDDQRAELAPPDKENRPAPAPALADKKVHKLHRSASSGNKHGSSSEAMLDMITDLQSARMDSQRAELRPAPRPAPAAPAAPEQPAGAGAGASLPGLRHQHTLADKPEDDFLDMIARVQGSRLEEQRTAMPARGPGGSTVPPRGPGGSTVPDDDFFAQLMRAQDTRMDDQRAEIPINRDNKTGASKK